MWNRIYDVQRTLMGLAAWFFLANFNAILAAGIGPVAAHPAVGSSFSMSRWLSEVLCRSEEHPNHPAVSYPTGYRIRKVVLDAGHGGKDPGCRGASSLEKHNALAIVLKLGALIQSEYPDVQVIYTRTTDVFVELQERAAIANRNNADLFISVHCNSISVAHVKGVETYVMGLHTAESNLEVAKRENAVIFLEENYQRNYGGYDPNSPEAHIFGSLWQSAYLEQSILFADYVQQYARTLAKREDRGVKQAGFIVLHRTAIPAVLIEVGFLTNRDEERFLSSEEGQMQMADAIFEAFRAYKARMEGVPLTARKSTAPSNTLSTGAPPPPTVPSPKAETPLPAVTLSVQPVSNTATTAPTSIGDRYADEFIELPPSAKHSKGQYRIHLLSWNTRLDRNTGQLALLTDVEEVYADGQYHYYLGRFMHRTEAEKLLPDLYNLGFRTARVIAQ